MKFEFSAGGIVYKKQNGNVSILVAQHSGHKGWVFPKGLIGDHIENEAKEETAVREVKEETGVFGKIIKALKPVTYWYVMDGEKHKKTVYYFLMEYLSGDPKDHDWEMQDAKFITEEEIRKLLTYPSERKAFDRAVKLYENRDLGMSS